MRRRLLSLLLVVLAAAVLLAGCSATGQTHTFYRCPMHPDYVSDKPGDCPICGMKLVPFEKGAAPGKKPATLPAVDSHPAAPPNESHVVYSCPMHPEVQQDKPGTCPKCGMDLERHELRQSDRSGLRSPSASYGGQAEGQTSGVRSQTWREPAVVGASMSETPRDAPQMQDMPGMPGMPATPAKPAGRSGGTASQGTPAEPAQPQTTGGHQHQPPAGDASGSLAPVHVGAEPGRLAGVRTVAAAKGTLTGTIRAVGTVVTPETGVRQVTTKVAGFVEKLYVNSVGRPVTAGEPLFDLYSPELLATQEEYLHAKQVAAQFSASRLPEVQRGGQDLVAAARRRLELFDVPADFLARLDETGKPQRTVKFRAPFSGYVMDKTVVEGQRVEPGMNLMTIADLSRAWVTANLYEGEAAAARVGRTARVSLPYDDTVTIAGRIDLVYPTLDAESRTLKVRFAFPNPRLALKPGMFVNVEIEALREPGIVVPESAVIDTGTRQVVFVETAPGHFEPRDVRVGMRSDGKAVLRAGVHEGEQVAMAANFLLDSESRLRGAIR